jgi:hypothetical protein
LRRRAMLFPLATVSEEATRPFGPRRPLRQACWPGREPMTVRPPGASQPARQGRCPGGLGVREADERSSSSGRRPRTVSDGGVYARPPAASIRPGACSRAGRAHFDPQAQYALRGLERAHGRGAYAFRESPQGNRLAGPPGGEAAGAFRKRSRRRNESTASTAKDAKEDNDLKAFAILGVLGALGVPG